jgi:hypothetical protein
VGLLGGAGLVGRPRSCEGDAGAADGQMNGMERGMRRNGLTSVCTDSAFKHVSRKRKAKTASGCTVT